MEQVEINNAALEVLKILEYLNPEIMNKIPEKLILKFKELASNANKIIELDFDKKLSEQNISDTAKDLLALIYYSYIATKEEKIELKENWRKNNE